MIVLFLCVTFYCAVSAQDYYGRPVLTGPRHVGIDPYYPGTGSYPGIYDRGLDMVPGGIHGPVGGSSLSSSTDICRIYGEIARHDHRGYVRTCRYSHDCQLGPLIHGTSGFSTCRRTAGSAYGMCCERPGILPGGTPDYHCQISDGTGRTGAPSAGFCDSSIDCHGSGMHVRHYRCEISPGYPRYYDSYGRTWRGLCCPYSSMILKK